MQVIIDRRGSSIRVARGAIEALKYARGPRHTYANIVEVVVGAGRSRAGEFSLDATAAIGDGVVDILVAMAAIFLSGMYVILICRSSRGRIVQVIILHDAVVAAFKPYKSCIVAGVICGFDSVQLTVRHGDARFAGRIGPGRIVINPPELDEVPGHRGSAPV